MSVAPTSISRFRRISMQATHQHRALVAGGVISFIAILLAIIGPWITPYSATSGTAAAQLLPPSRAHLFGTDSVGLDVFSRVIAAPRIDLTIALMSTLLALFIGTLIGAAAGYYRNIWSEILMRVSDLVQSFPVFILALATSVVAGHNLSGIIFVIAFVNAPIYVRLVRAQVLSLRERTFIEAAEALGEQGFQVIFRHLIPNTLAPIFAQASITVGFAMLLTAGLSFVGAGVRVPTPEWGSMIAIGGSNIVTGQWWPSLFPGLALSVTVFGFALLGDALAGFFDPQGRRS